MNRVVVTGMGIISPIGNSVAEFRFGLRQGVCGIGEITKFDTSDVKVKLAGEVKNFDPMKYYDSLPEARRSDLYTQYAIAAASEAVAESGIDCETVDHKRVGVYIGSGIGGMSTFIAETNKLRDRGADRVSPMFIPMMISNMASGSVSIRYGFKGPTLPVVTACATSTHAIGEAYRAIKHGYADAIVAGGAEATVNPLAVAGFTNCKALSLATDPECASLPFDKRRGGFVMGEGAAVIVLEEYEHALKRGANILCEVCGYGNTADAYHMTSPAPGGEGAADAIRLAAAEAGILPTPELYVNAHGTGTAMNDKVETEALKLAFGEDAYKIHISSTKSMTGHMLGATGGAEAIASVIAMQDSFVPPTINYLEKDEDCDLDYTPGKAVEAELKYVLSTSLGFGGHNGCIAFKKI